jgi:hypothetical protein
MLRLSDARMSGTRCGASILHAAPEAYIGGPLALVKTGDLITVDVPARRIHLEVSDAELAARRAAWVARPPRYARGYGWMAAQHILPDSAARRHALSMAIDTVPLSDPWALREMQICMRNLQALPAFARDPVDLLVADAESATAPPSGP